MRIHPSLVAGLLLGVAAPAAAQSDFNFPTGAGAAVTSSAVNYSGGGIGSARANFIAAVGGGRTVTVSSPRGNVTVSAATSAALGGVLQGNGAGTQPGNTMIAALGGGPQATALTNALAGLSGTITVDALSAAVTAFNALIAALPAGSDPNEAVAAARAAIAGFLGM